MIAMSSAVPFATFSSYRPGRSFASARPFSSTSSNESSAGCWYFRSPRGSVKMTWRTFGSLSSMSRILSTCSWSSATTIDASQWSMTKPTSVRFESW